MVSQIACPVLYNLLNLKKMVSFKSAFSPAQIKEDLWLKTFGILQNKSTSGRPSFQTKFWASGVEEDS